MIQTDALSKRYGDKLAVDDVSFTVEPGEVLGFLGPNGAGKSTTMKMIAGFCDPVPA
ncbi:ABC transporter ATP-binding protein, partial [sediment metagenome]